MGRTWITLACADSVSSGPESAGRKSRHGGNIAQANLLFCVAAPPLLSPVIPPVCVLYFLLSFVESGGGPILYV